MTTSRSGYRICDVMTRKPVAVQPDTTITHCAKRMEESKIGSLVVLKDTKLVGYITEQLLVREILAKKRHADTTTAAEVMHKRVETIGPEKDILEALHKMKDLAIRQLPVIDSERDKLVGLLTLNDIVQFQPEALEVLSEQIPLQEEKRRTETALLEGTCDACGEYSEKLYEREEAFVCVECKETKTQTTVA